MAEQKPIRPRVCVLTPEGRGALGVVRVWGPGTLAAADAAFRPMRGARLAETGPGRLRLGRVGAGRGDEVVAVVIAGESQTEGEPAEVEVEIHCHGGPAAVELVLEALVEQGAERRQPVAWVRQAAGAAIEAEALVDLARAPTLRTAEILLEQAQGALAGAVLGLIERLDVELEAAKHGLDELRDRARLGLRMVGGWRVVLAGRPNVGKSRLLNALAGYGRAIVDAAPGTTRDVVTVRTALDGWPVEIADTAGLREAGDAIEAAGIALARSRQREADLLLVVLDRSEPWTAEDQALFEATTQREGTATAAPCVVVANKADLPAAWETLDRQVLSISAERGDGVEALTQALASRLVASPPPAGAGVPFRPSHFRRLDRAERALRQGDVAAARRHLTALVEERVRRRGQETEPIERMKEEG